MNFFNILIRSMKLSKMNIILVQPLLIFLLVTSLLASSSQSVVAGSVSPAYIVLLISIYAMYAAFLAGWYNMYKNAIELSAKPVISPQQYSENSLTIFQSFMPGVGKYFLQVLLAMTIFVSILFLLFSASSVYLAHIIGHAKLLAFLKALGVAKTKQDIIAVASSISVADKIFIEKIFLILTAIVSFLSYVSMFLVQSIVVSDKSSLKAYWNSIKAVFKSPLTSFNIFLLYFVGNFVALFLNLIATTNFILQLFALMYSVCFTVYYVMVTFIYFDEYCENINNSRSDS